MVKHNKHNKPIDYNLEKLDNIIMVALIADQNYIYVRKDLYKLAKQLLAVKKLTKKITIKTY